MTHLVYYVFATYLFYYRNNTADATVRRKALSARESPSDAASAESTAVCPPPLTAAGRAAGTAAPGRVWRTSWCRGAVKPSLPPAAQQGAQKYHF